MPWVRNRCDMFSPREHFRHSARWYIFETDSHALVVCQYLGGTDPRKSLLMPIATPPKWLVVYPPPIILSFLGNSVEGFLKIISTGRENLSRMWFEQSECLCRSTVQHPIITLFPSPPPKHVSRLLLSLLTSPWGGGLTLDLTYRGPLRSFDSRFPVCFRVSLSVRTVNDLTCGDLKIGLTCSAFPFFYFERLDALSYFH